MCREFVQRRPAGVTAADHQIAAGDTAVPVRRYHPRSITGEPAVVYFHGGGFVVGGLDSHDDVCSEICAATGFPVVSVDYRLSPENNHPAAFDDALTVVRSLAVEQPLILCGDSAGGNLAAAVCHAVRNETDVHRRLLGQVLVYPGLGGDMSCGSYVTHAEAPLLSARDVRFYSMIRTGGVIVTGDPTSAPLHDDRFDNLPPTVIFSAQCDPLADDGRIYAQRIRRAGGRAHWYNEAGLVHGYLRARATVSRARLSFERILQSLEMLGAARWTDAC